MTPRLRSKAWWIGSLLLLAIALAVMVVLAGRTTIAVDSARLPNALLEARASGLAISATDLDDGKRVAAKNNAFPLLRRFTSHASVWTFESHELLRKAILAGDVSGAEAALEPFEYLIGLAVEASSKPSFKVDFDYDDGPYENINLVGAPYRASRLLCLRAEFHDLRGDFDLSLKDYETALRLAGLPLADGGVYGLSMEASILERVAGSIALTLGRPKTLEQLGRLDALLDRPIEGTDAYEAHRVEMYLSLVDMRNARLLEPIYRGEVDHRSDAGERHERIRTSLSTEMPQDSKTRAYITQALTQYPQVLKAIKDRGANYLELHPKLVAIDAELEKIGDSDKIVIGLRFWHAALESRVSKRTSLLALRGLIKVLIFRSKHHRLPTTLAEAGYTIKDPFSGKAFLLKSSATEVRIYSVGVDGVDNQGASRVEKKSLKNIDVVAASPPIPPR